MAVFTYAKTQMPQY